MRVYAYHRVSTKDQLDKNGLARQQDTVMEFILDHGWTRVKQYSEQQSGGVEFSERLTLVEMLDSAKQDDVQGIVVERMDRIARDLVAQEVFLSRAAQAGIRVFAADTGEDMTNSSDPSRVLMRQLFGALAQWEKAVIVKKLQDGRRRTAELTGRPCGGPVAYGFTPDQQLRREQRNVIASIKSWRAQGVTYGDIVRKLRSAGITPPNGEFWHRSTVYKLSKADLDNPPLSHTS